MKRVAPLLLALLLVMIPVAVQAQDPTGLYIGLEHWWTLDETAGTRADSHGTANLTDHNTVGYAGGLRSDGGGGDPWWSGAIAAYQPIGADSYAASLLDLSGNGNNLYVPSGATTPGWSAGEGWIKAAYGNVGLDTGIFPSTLYSIIIRFSDYVPHPTFIVPLLGLSDGSYSYRIYPYRNASDNNHTFQNRNGVTNSPGITAGVLAMTNSNGYYNGSQITGITPPPLTNFTNSVALFGQNVSGVFNGGNPVNIQAVGIWSTTLDAATVATKSAQMAALGSPTGAAKFTSANYEYLSSTAIETDSFTISTWNKPTTITGTQTIATQDNAWLLGYNSSGYFAEIDQGGSTVTLSNTFPITTAYNLVTLSYDADTQAVSLYINDLTPATTTANLTGPITDTFRMGVDESLTYYLNGNLDEFGLWDYALDPIAIDSLYNDGQGLLYDELGGALVNTDPTQYVITLPSGGQGVITMSITAGEAVVIAVMSVLVLLAIYTAIRGMTTSARAKA